MISTTKISLKDVRDIIFSSVFFILSYAPSPFGFFVYIAFIPQLVLYQRSRFLRSFIYGYIIGLIVNSSVLFWLLLYSGTAFSIIVLLNALQFAVFGWILSFIFNKNNKLAILFFPFVWTFLEYIRQYGELAFNWLNIAYTQTYYIYLIQFLDITGQSGVVLWICLLNTLFYLLWINRSNSATRIKLGLTILLLFLLPLSYGICRLAEAPSADGISIAYVQPNITLEEKWDDDSQFKNLQTLISMTDSILITKPDLVIWPETAIPYYLSDKEDDFIFLTSHVELNNYYLLTGAIDYSVENGKRLKHNAAYFFTPGEQIVHIYRKLLLVPGEEIFPLMNSIPDWIAPSTEFQMAAGQKPVLFNMRSQPFKMEYNGSDWQISRRSNTLRSINISCVICYESVFPNLIQRFFDRDCDLLVVITNDAWFGYTSQPYQHLQASVLRAIEQRCSVVRCANSGISSFIDPYGRRYLDSPLFRSTMAQKVMPVRINSSIYSRNGEIVGVISGIFVISLLTFLALNLKFKIL